MRLLARAGDRSVTIDAIAREAGLVRAQVYELFPSKDALVAAALERETRRMDEFMLVAGGRAFEQPLPERLRTLYRSVFDYNAAFPDSLGLLSAVGPTSRRAGPDRWRELVARRMRRDFEQLGYPSRQLPDVLATLLMGMVKDTIRRTLEEPGWDPDAVVELLVAFTLGGFDALNRSPAGLAVDRPRPGEATAGDEAS